MVLSEALDNTEYVEPGKLNVESVEENAEVFSAAGQQKVRSINEKNGCL